MSLGRLFGPIGMGALPANVGGTRDDAWAANVRAMLVARGNGLTTATDANWQDRDALMREALGYVAAFASRRPSGVSETAWNDLQTTIRNQTYTYTSQLGVRGYRAVRNSDGTYSAPVAVPAATPPSGDTSRPRPGGGGGGGGGSSYVAPPGGDGKGGQDPTTTPPGTTPPASGGTSSIMDALWPADADWYARPGLWLGLAAGAVVVGVLASKKSAPQGFVKNPRRRRRGRRNPVSFQQAQQAGHDLAYFRYGKN